MFRIICLATLAQLVQFVPSAQAQEESTLVVPRPVVGSRMTLELGAGEVAKVTGRVKSVYSRPVRQRGIDWIRHVAEIAVIDTAPADNAAAFNSRGLIYVRFWSRADGRPSVQAVNRAPRSGQLVSVELTRAVDGGLDVLAGDRIAVLRQRIAAKPVAPIVVIPQPAFVDNSNLVRGVVRLYDEAQAGAGVDLIVEGGVVQTTTTDSAGHFVFEATPPGPYGLAAHGVVKNKIRSSPIIPITVQSPPAAPTTIDVQLEP